MNAEIEGNGESVGSNFLEKLRGCCAANMTIGSTKRSEAKYRISTERGLI
jgi:hypothetical protein